MKIYFEKRLTKSQLQFLVTQTGIYSAFVEDYFHLQINTHLVKTFFRC